MKFFEIFQESLMTLTLNKLRTGLAVLGIVIGIGSVIALMSLGQATQKSIQNQIQSLGSNLLTVSPGSQMSGMVRGAGGGAKTLTNEDGKALAAGNLQNVNKISMEYSGRAQVVTSENNTNTQIYGVTPVYSEIHKVSVSTGNFITERDNSQMAKVAVVGTQVVTDLFGEGTSPIGESIRINGQSFTIIGIAASKGGSGFMNQDDIVYVPLSTAQKQLFGANYLTSIAVEAKSSEVMIAAQDEIGYFLLSRHRINDPTKADFRIQSQQDVLSMATSTTGTFVSLLSGIAAISLLVGGIGIMNIMLVTVTERTREIGLRKALGAKKKVIVTQFLTESVILTFTGGMIGIVVGMLISFIYSKVTSSIFTISPSSIMLAFGVSAGIGIIFGYYPAKKASNLQPIEALRWE